jgi:hypothetical protein
MTRCRVCNRILKDPESVARLTGPTCNRRLYPRAKCIHFTRSVDGSELFEGERQLKLFEEERK